MTKFNNSRRKEQRNVKSRIGTNKQRKNVKAKNNRKNVVNANNKSGIRGRLGLKKSPVLQNRLKNDSNTQSNTVKSRLGGVQKTVQTTAAGKSEVRLFTRHFDARSKIQKKEGNQSPVKSHSSKASPNKKSLGNVQRDAKSRTSKSKPQPSPKKKTTVKSDRESTFTGKSIQIKTQNNLIKNAKARKSAMKGNSLSVVTPKNPARNNRNKKQTKNNTVSQPLKQSSFQVSPFTQEQQPMLSPVSRPVSAKVVISNLHHSVSQDDIQELFGAIGPLRQTILKNIGTAEVVYNTAEDAFAAYTKYHGRNLDGQPMILKITTADDVPTFKPPVRTDPRAEGFLGARSSNARRNPSSSLPSQQFYQPPMTSSFVPPSSTRGAPTKPVVFTVKL